jgi:hypothetical protein
MGAALGSLTQVGANDDDSAGVTILRPFRDAV